MDKNEKLQYWGNEYKMYLPQECTPAEHDWIYVSGIEYIEFYGRYPPDDYFKKTRGGFMFSEKLKELIRLKGSKLLARVAPVGDGLYYKITFSFPRDFCASLSVEKLSDGFVSEVSILAREYGFKVDSVQKDAITIGKK